MSHTAVDLTYCYARRKNLESGEHEIAPVARDLEGESIVAIDDVYVHPADEAVNTVRVSPEDNTWLVAWAFEHTTSDEADSRNVDDEITIEAPAPEVPAGTPSPLGDEEEPADRDIDAMLNDLGPMTLRPALLERDREATVIVNDNASCTEPTSWAEPRSVFPGSGDPSSVIRIRHQVSPEEIQAAREARDASREDRAKTRLLVLGIWTMVVSLTALLAFLLLVT